MDVTPLIKANTQVIQSYGEGQIKVSGQRYTSPIIVTPEETVLWKNVASFEDLNLKTFQKIFEIKTLDVCLLGTGETARFLSPDLRRELKAHNLNVEIMNTGAVCRTYNVLIAEGRQIAAALLPV